MTSTNDTTRVTVTRKSRNIGIAAHAGASSGPQGWYFEANDKPASVGGCAVVRRAVAEYRRLWSGGTAYRTDLFVGGKRVLHEDGSHKTLMNFCLDTPDAGGRYLYGVESVTVSVEG